MFDREASLKGQITTAQVGEDRGAEGCGVWGGSVHRGRGLGRGLCPLPEKFLILALDMVSFGAFWMVYFTVQLTVLHAKPV